MYLYTPDLDVIHFFFQVPARAAAAATIARALAGLPPHQRHSFASSSEELSSIYGSRPRGQVVEELEEEFYEEVFLLRCDNQYDFIGWNPYLLPFFFGLLIPR